jgi:type II secretory pathway pseudopilin PulG
MRFARSGYSLLDLSVALTLTGIALGVLLPAARRQTDRVAVLTAREAVIGRIARARREARLQGGAALQIRREGGLLWLESEAPARDTLRLERRFGVRMETSSPSAAIVFDALGIGRLANRSVTLVRGDARATLTVSAYGRVRRQ